MAKKDAYYFSHDSNAQDDPKCMTLIDQMGMEGYGIFWGLIEKLRAEKEYKLPLCVISPFAKRWGTSKEKVETVIKNYGLFTIENEFFFSIRLHNSMEEKSEKARLSANYRWNNATALQTHTDRSANGMQNDAIKVKESKVKKSKEKEIESKVNTALLGIVIYDAEKEILKNQVEIERICMSTGSSLENAKMSLRKYHLYLEEREMYPKGRKAVFAGFEKWLLNEKKFINNGKSTNKTVGKEIEFD